MKVADFGVAIELPENGLVASGMYDNSRRIILFCKLVQLVLGKGGGGSYGHWCHIRLLGCAIVLVTVKSTLGDFQICEISYLLEFFKSLDIYQQLQGCSLKALCPQQLTVKCSILGNTMHCQLVIFVFFKD